MCVSWRLGIDERLEIYVVEPHVRCKGKPTICLTLSDLFEVKVAGQLGKLRHPRLIKVVPSLRGSIELVKLLPRNLPDLRLIEVLTSVNLAHIDGN